jgi:hypothetical protein
LLHRGHACLLHYPLFPFLLLVIVLECLIPGIFIERTLMHYSVVEHFNFSLLEDKCVYNQKPHFLSINTRNKTFTKRDFFSFVSWAIRH